MAGKARPKRLSAEKVNKKKTGRPSGSTGRPQAFIVKNQAGKNKKRRGERQQMSSLGQRGNGYMPAENEEKKKDGKES